MRLSCGVNVFVCSRLWSTQGEADREVLQVFRNAYEEVRRGYNDALINERKTNLAALLLDIANKEGDASLSPAIAPPLPPLHPA